MLYLISIGTFLAGVAFTFRSIAWAFDQAALPYQSQAYDETSAPRLRPEGGEERTAGIAPACSDREQVEEENAVSI